MKLLKTVKVYSSQPASLEADGERLTLHCTHTPEGECVEVEVMQGEGLRRGLYGLLDVVWMKDVAKLLGG